MDEFEVYSIPGFQEPFSCFTHLFAAPVFAVLGFFLVRRGREPADGNGRTKRHWGRTLSLLLMASSTVFLLSMSGVYHLLGPGTGRYVMKQLDVAGVFALIAGTATPVHAILFTGIQRWGPLLLMWSIAITGITLRTIFWESLPGTAGLAIFLVMGWGGALSCYLLWRRYGFRFVCSLLYGGLAYTIGATILGLHWPTMIPGVIGPHELWHIAVLAGLGLHWHFVFQFAAGAPGHGSARTNGSNTAADEHAVPSHASMMSSSRIAAWPGAPGQP